MSSVGRLAGRAAANARAARFEVAPPAAAAGWAAAAGGRSGAGGSTVGTVATPAAGLPRLGAYAPGRVSMPTVVSATPIAASAAAARVPHLVAVGAGADALPTTKGMPRGGVPAGTTGEHVDFGNTELAFGGKSTVELLRSYAIFRLCTISALTTHAAGLIRFGRAVSERLTEWGVRVSFFHQFCVTEAGVAAKLAELKAAGIGGILDYAAEADVSPDAAAATAATVASGAGTTGLDAELDANLVSVIRAITDASHKGGGFAAVKMTGLAPPELLQHITNMLHDHRRAFRRFNKNSLPNPYADLHVPPSEFVRVLAGPRISERDALDLFAAIDSRGDGVIDYLEWSDFMALMRVGGQEAQAVATYAMRAATPTYLLSLLVPAAEVMLTPAEQESLRRVLARADKMARAAWRAGVTIMVDAEQTYIQPAVDYLTMNMMRKYNRPNPDLWRSPDVAHALNVTGDVFGLNPAGGGGVAATAPATWPYNDLSVLATANDRARREAGADAPAAAMPVVYNTYQAYLTDALPRLQLDLQRAEVEGYLFGAKLVRGAYMASERPLAKAKGYKDPIHATLGDTHACYAACTDLLLDAVRKQGAEVLVASHNEASMTYTMSEMAKRGIPATSRSVSFGQLLGMCDHITYSLGAAHYNVYKYVPYGNVLEVVPYLVRRAQENSDMLGGVGKELRLIGKELQRRFRLKSGGSGAPGGVAMA